MAASQICRICLVQDVKMYKYENYFAKYYEELVAKLLNDTDKLPKWFCFECATILQKYHDFRQKCYRGLKALTEIVQKQESTVSTMVNRIDRRMRNLESPYQVTSDSNIRVKTYVFKYLSPSMLHSQTITTFRDNFESVVLEKASRDQRKESYEKVLYVETNADNCNNQLLIGDEENCNDKDIDEQQTGIKEHNLKSNTNIHIIKSTQKYINKEETKFSRSIKKKFLNSSHWLKINLTDEHAEREFKAKGLNRQYLKANFKCSECFRGFSQQEMLKRHMKIKHCKSKGPLECRFCHMRVKWKSRLQKHLKEHYTRYKCLRCELSFSVEEAAFQHDDFHNGVTRICPHCGEQFKHASSFYTHLRKHRSKHICALCGESFLSEFGLYMHRKVKHILTTAKSSKTDKNLFCEVCDIAFETQQAYDEHLAQSAMHTIAIGEDCISQPFKWRYSQRRAPRKYTRCSICERNFSTYVAYSKHHLSEHPNVPLAANAYKSNVRNICEICGLSVAPVSFASHINTHTRDIRHTCNICGTQLSSKSGLNRHRLTHTRERPNKCSLCDETFAQTTNMKLHYRAVHMKGH